MKGLSPQEVVEAAIRVEERGKELYASLSATAKTPQVKAMFRFFAEQETLHAKVFAGILARADFRPHDQTPEDEYAAFFRNVSREYVFTADRIAEATKKGFPSLDDALSFAAGIEEESVRVYRALRDAYAGTADTLDAVIKEEEQHCSMIAAMRAQIGKTV